MNVMEQNNGSKKVNCLTRSQGLRAIAWMNANKDRLRGERPSYERLAQMLMAAMPGVEITEWNARTLKKDSGLDWVAKLEFTRPPTPPRPRPENFVQSNTQLMIGAIAELCEAMAMKTPYATKLIARMKQAMENAGAPK